MNKLKRGIILTITLVLFLSFPVLNAVQAGLIFEDNFDATPDWNVQHEYDGECSVGLCAANTYPGNWTLYRIVPGSGGLSPVGSIRRLPGNAADHTSNTGKAFVVYNESVPNVNWPGDAILGKNFGPSANYNELYVRFWLRTQPGWQQVSSMSNKIFRASHWRQESSYPNIFQWADQNTPFQIWSFGASNGNAAFINSYRCEGTPYTSNGRSSDYYCGNPTYDECISAGGDTTECTRLYVYPNGGDFRTDNYQVFNGGVPTAASNFADGQWHQYDFRLKVNDSGVANGTFEWKYDGKVMESYSHVMWKESSASSSIGWNAFAIGGNSDNIFGGSTVAEQWYAIDDVVVSTTPIPADYVPGGGSSGTAPPAPPANLRTR